MKLIILEILHFARALRQPHSCSWLPPGIPENVEELVAPAGGAPHITPHVRPFVKRNAQGVIRVNVFGEAVAGDVAGIFRLEGTEKPVPDNKRAAMVAVDVLGVRGVMNTMVRGSVEYGF